MSPMHQYKKALASFCCCCSSKNLFNTFRGRHQYNNYYYFSTYLINADNSLYSIGMSADTKISQKRFYHLINSSLPVNVNKKTKHLFKVKNRFIEVWGLNMQSCRNFNDRRISMNSKNILNGRVDRYNGVWVDLRELSSKDNEDIATEAFGKTLKGVVINEKSEEVLVVMDKNRRQKLWKFPGGLSDLGEDIAVTAVREVREETGVHTEFQSILAFRQQHDHPNAFGRSDIYVICRLKPLTLDLQPCSEEIAATQWISAKKLQSESQASQMTHTVARLVMQGLRHGFDTVDITSHEIESIYKKTKINMFLRPLSIKRV